MYTTAIGNTLSNRRTAAQRHREHRNCPMQRRKLEQIQQTLQRNCSYNVRHAAGPAALRHPPPRQAGDDNLRNVTDDDRAREIGVQASKFRDNAALGGQVSASILESFKIGPDASPWHIRVDGKPLYPLCHRGDDRAPARGRMSKIECGRGTRTTNDSA